MQVRAAHLAGVLQLILAVGVLVEVVRRFVFGSEPESLVMMAIAFVALIANTSCLLLISRSEEHTSELQSLMRISYAVFCLKKKKITNAEIYILEIYKSKINVNNTVIQ